jgi:cobalt-zinc-cadmium efflux system protein
MHSHHHSESHCHCAVPSSPEQIRALRIALVLVACFSVAELWVSVQSHSLSLMADAGHMVADVFAIALSLWTALWTRDPSRQAERDRLNAIAALINGSLLLLVASWLAWEAVSELRFPPSEILSLPVAITAAVGLGVNALNAYFLHAHAEDNLNVRGAFLHMLADAGSCLGVLVGALLIAKFGWFRADGVVSGAIALLIATSAIPLMRQSWATLNTPPSETSAETM